MMENKLIAFMAKVGGGARVSKDLSYNEAKDAMNAIVDGAYHPVTFGSFTLALRWKPETAEEMAGFADAMNERIIKPDVLQPVYGLVSSAGAYDGKERTVNFSIAASLTAAAAGVPTLIHGSENIPAKYGMTPFHILRELGINPLRTVNEAMHGLHTCGIGYLHQSVVNPQMHNLLEHRKQVGKRTFLNSIEPLINPYNASAHIGGFFHRPFGELMGNAIATMETGFPRALMIAGIEGSDEIKPGRSLIVEWNDNQLQTYYIEPFHFGIHASDEETASKVSGDIHAMAKESAELITAYLNQSAPEGYCDLVLLNAGLRIYAGGITATIEDGYQLARQVYQEGKVSDVFQRINESISELDRL